MPTDNEDEEKPEVTLFVHDTRLLRSFMRCELRAAFIAVGCKRVGRRTRDNK